MTRDFHLGDLLTVTTGKLVSNRHVDGLYDILSFMSGDDVYTHQLGRVSEECKPYLLSQFPQLQVITGDDVTGDNWKQWLDDLVEKLGPTFSVTPMPKHAHERIDPLSELVEKVHPDRIIVI